jgi:hypothetical protein
MKVMAFCIMLLGVIAFWSFRPEAIDREDLQGEAVAMNYAIFRNAVLDFAHKFKTPGSVLPDNPDLVLPYGWLNIRPWAGLIQEENDGRLYCYVWGPAQPQEVAAVLKLFNQSQAIGWNNGGVFVRNGQARPLPSFIPHRALVSVIRVD